MNNKYFFLQREMAFTTFVGTSSARALSKCPTVPMMVSAWRKTLYATGFAVLAVAALPASAQSQDSVMVDVSSCVDIENDFERFQCYERQAQENRSAPRASEENANEQAGPPITVPDPAARNRRAPVAETPAPARSRAPQTREQAEARFGLPEVRETREEEVIELTATVAEVEQLTRGILRITLDNGQVWRQMVSKQYRLRPGYEVRIYPSGWGDAFRMSSSRLGSFIQVERLE